MDFQSLFVSFELHLMYRGEMRLNPNEPGLASNS